MNSRKLFYTSVSLVLVMFASATGTGWDDARSIAMAGSYTAVARGYDAIGFNPANLGLPDKPGTQVQLFAFGSKLNNNSFSMSDYKRYNGAYLSESDKREILSKIPSEGLEFRGTSAASALAFTFGPIAVSTTVEAAGTGTLSKDMVDLAFFGNKIGETISIDNADAQGLAHVDLNLAYGRRIKSFDWGDLSAGVNLKYIYGIASIDVTESNGSATTQVDGIDADGSIIMRSATGGSGFGLDIGTAATYREDWVFSAGLKNLVSSISWNKDAKETEYTFEVISLTAETASEDSTVVSDEVERSVGSFSTSLAPQVNLGAAYTIGKFLLASDLKFGLKDKAGVSTTPEISVGSEFHQFSFMPLRAGVSFGGVHGTSLGLGGGFRLSSFFIDLAWASSGTLLPSFGRGLSLAVSSGLRF